MTRVVSWSRAMIDLRAHLVATRDIFHTRLLDVTHLYDNEVFEHCLQSSGYCMGGLISMRP